MKTKRKLRPRTDIFVVGYLGQGNFNGQGQPVWGQNDVEGGGQAIRPLTQQEATEKIKELVSKSPKVIFKLVEVKRYLIKGAK